MSALSAVDGPVMLNQVAAALGFDPRDRGTQQYWSWDRLLEVSCDLYWTRRPQPRRRRVSRPAPAPTHWSVSVATGVRPCGTRAAYERHLRHGEHPCWMCAHGRRVEFAAWTRTRPADLRLAA